MSKFMDRFQKSQNQRLGRNPCVCCSSHNIKASIPIKMELPLDMSPKSVLQAWATVTRDNPELAGTAQFYCADCGYRGDAVDCSSYSYEEVGQSKELFCAMIKAWNESKPNRAEVNGE